MDDKKRINIEILKNRAKTDPFVASYLRLIIRGEELRKKAEQEENNNNSDTK